MKTKKIFTLLFGLLVLLTACKKEENPIASNDLNVPQLFAPPENADPKVKTLYNNYGVWIRMDYTNWAEVTNGILGIDDIGTRFGGIKIDDSERQNAITYTQTLLSNVSEKYTKSFFPLELFFVKTYGRGYFVYNFKVIGRSRLVVSWPNQMDGTQPITDPATHYYKDSVLTRAVWNNLGGMMTARMDKPIAGFEAAGKPYSSEAFSKIMNEYFVDYDVEKRDAALKDLAIAGGFITGYASTSFDSDFTEWITLLSTESYANIKARYLDNNERRTNKYNILIKFFNSYGWDIQAAGNKYRAKLDGFTQE